MTRNATAGGLVGDGTDSATQPWIALVQAGMLVGKYPARAGDVNGRAATRLAVADGHNVEVYEVDPRTSSPPPPIGTEVEPLLWGWARVS